MDAAASPRFDVSRIPPNVFAIVMATGIVSLAAQGAGYPTVAQALFALNAVIYPLLLGLLLARVWKRRPLVVSDLTHHATAPGFFTMVAAPCVLGNQCLLLGNLPEAAALLLGIGLAHWLALTYLMLPALMTSKVKPDLEHGWSGAWLLVVVGTQALSLLTSLLVGRQPEPPELALFAALGLWLVGSMIYFWIISQIFHRILFLPLAANDLTPPYWINMGAMAIATLAGARLISVAGHSELLTELLPFLKGMTLLFWSTATWWIPILFVLGGWRHLSQQVPLAYDHGYWAAVFPLGMYTACTRGIIDVLQLPYLAAIPAVFVWIALAAWGVTFAGLLRHVAHGMLAKPKVPAAGTRGETIA
jgi:tellurite resistance protein TehA-like permease